MSVRLIGTDSDDPRLPSGVVVGASSVSVLDTGGNFSATTVEAALAELADLIEAGGGETGGTGTVVSTFLYSVVGATRPTADIVFWIPVTSDLGDPDNAVAGDVVLRSVEDAVEGQNGVTGLSSGTGAEYAALTPDPDVVYVVTA